MENKKIYLDEKGYQQYLEGIVDLRNKLKNNGKEKSEAYTSAVGDGWHDNFLFEDAVRQERMIRTKLEEELKKEKYIVIVESKDDSNTIDIGDVIKLNLIFSEDDIETSMYKLVGGNPQNRDSEIKEISLNSPLGSKIYSKKENEEFEYEINNCIIKGVIIKITKEKDKKEKDKKEINFDFGR